MISCTHITEERDNVLCVACYAMVSRLVRSNYEGVGTHGFSCAEMSCEYKLCLSRNLLTPAS